MYDPFWNDEPLTRQKVDGALFEIDDELSAQNEEELVIVIMLMPVIFSLHDAEPDNRIVHPT